MTRKALMWILLFFLSISALLISGIILGDFNGYLAFTGLVISAFLSASAFVSQLFAQESISKLVRRAWTTTSLILLTLSGIIPPEASSILIYCLIVLSFPVSLLWVCLILLLETLIGTIGFIHDTTSHGWTFALQFIALWLPCTLLGYIQWFKIFPQLVNFLRTKFRPRTS